MSVHYRVVSVPDPQQQTASEIFADSISPGFPKQLVFCKVPCNDGGGAQVWWLAVRYENLLEASRLCSDNNSRLLNGMALWDALEQGQKTWYPVYKLLGFRDGRYIEDTKDRKLETMCFHTDHIFGFLGFSNDRLTYYKYNQGTRKIFHDSIRQACELVYKSNGLSVPVSLTNYCTGIDRALAVKQAARRALLVTHATYPNEPAVEPTNLGSDELRGLESAGGDD